MRKRQDIGRVCRFDSSGPIDLAFTGSDETVMSNFDLIHELTRTIDTKPIYSAHSVNTDHVEVHSRGQVHVEGGWPREIDPSEPQDTAKWRKRLDKDPQFAPTVAKLCHKMKKVINDNKTIDLFGDIGASQKDSLEVHTFKSDSAALFKDPVGSRTVSRVSWHPDSLGRFAASYTNPATDAGAETTFSYIWECDLPNQPMLSLSPSSSLLSIHMYTRNGDLIVGGCSNGTVDFFDIRASQKPVACTMYEHSHTDSVSDVSWILSKTHSEIVSTSTDGRVSWWDVRHLSSGPVESCDLAPYAGTAMEWQQEAGPTKFLIGTQEGVVLSLNKRPKKPIEIGGWFGVEDKGGLSKHTGPIMSIKRNLYHPKYFLSVGGDNCMKIWLEDLKTPVYETPHCQSQYLCGSWSPSRASVFVGGRYDGVLDFFDYGLSMGPPSYSHKVSEKPLTSVAVENKGRMLAAGDASGTITLLNLSDELSLAIANEKILTAQVLEREQRREKNLDTLRKQSTTGAPSFSISDPARPHSKRIDQKQYIARESEWQSMVGLEINPNEMSIRT